MSRSKTRTTVGRRTRQEWSKLLKDWRESGLHEALFCARHKLKLTTFRWWRSQLRHELADAAESSADSFVSCDLRVSGDAWQHQTSTSDDACEVLFTGDERRIRFSRDCPRDLVAMVLESLRRRPCS